VPRQCGSGPQLGFPRAYRSLSDAGSRTKSSEIIVNEAIGFVERHQHEPFFVNIWLSDTRATLDPDEKQSEPYVK